MSRLHALAEAAERHLPRAGLFAFLLLLANMYLLRVRVLSDVVAGGVVIVAVMVLLARAEDAGFRRAMLGWLAAAAAILLAGALAAAEVTLAEAWTGMHRLLLVACFVIFARMLLREHGGPRVMAMLFAAGAVSAALSVGLHLATAPVLLERIEMLGRGRNPIPAAAAVAAAALAGFALLRAGMVPSRWRLPAYAGIGAILLAMVLTQSRGPAIGIVLGAALLLLPRGPALRLGMVLAPLAFVAASSLVPLEASLRALFCDGEDLLCRPSLRLPLWQSAAEIIAAHPLWGLGASHRMGEAWLNNPQNAVLAIAVHFGLPFLLVAILAFGLLLRQLGRAEPGAPQAWAAAMMVFSAVYFAFEPSPFAFYNAHWLFFWLPVAVIVSSPPRSLG
jgi:hypothetical protein